MSPPIRLVHLGLGNFFRAHQAWYTAHSGARDGWGYAAFAGRGGDLAERLDRQGGWYTLVTRGPRSDGYEIIESVVRAHRADDPSWLDYVSRGDVGVMTLTVTEAGYVRRPDGALDAENPSLQADLAALRRDVQAPVRSVPARLVAGLAARRRADAGPVSIVPCDNMAANGEAVARVVQEFAERLDPSLRDWIAAQVSFVSTTVDRITPRPTPDDAAAVFAATGRRDECPVATEPFAEWVLAGDFPAGRPRWEDAGATFASDVTPYENRKLWLLNGAHSLLAYAGSLRGHTTVAEAIGDDICRGWVEQWWALAGTHLTQAGDLVASYCAALLERWANQRLRHLLAQIAADGSQKLPVRLLPVIRAERAEGAIPLAATRIVAAWICHLRGMGAPTDDVRADEFVAAAAAPPAEAAKQVVRLLDPALAADDVLVQAITEQVREFSATVR